MLGGYAHHTELRAWALKELMGYAADDELPDYRKVPAALETDLNIYDVTGVTQYTGRRISPHQLPAPARERGVGEIAPFPQGVKELEALVARAGPSVRFTPPGSAEYALLMTLKNQQTGNDNTEITSIHWDVVISSVEGVLDRIRTRLTQFVAEVRAAMPPDQQNPDPAQIGAAAERALHITAGDHAVVNVTNTTNTARTDAGGAATLTVGTPTPSAPQPWWHRSAVLWTAGSTLATIATAVIAYLALK